MQLQCEEELSRDLGDESQLDDEEYQEWLLNHPELVMQPLSGPPSPQIQIRPSLRRTERINAPSFDLAAGAGSAVQTPPRRVQGGHGHADE